MAKQNGKIINSETTVQRNINDYFVLVGWCVDYSNSFVELDIDCFVLVDWCVIMPMLTLNQVLVTLSQLSSSRSISFWASSLGMSRLSTWLAMEEGGRQ